ncbi:MAG TPA: M13-type metalloendopeptidase [Xanthobacteraceae bacterium]|nr:M13-type metalloendopeptidase [Xanthobacteraceae bacterium]
MPVKSRLLARATLALMLAMAGGASSRAQEPAEPAPHALTRLASQSIDQPAASPAAVPHQGATYGRWGFDDSGVDPQANAGDSFFDFANGAWAARTVIPADKSRFGMFDALTDKTQEQVRAIIEEAAKSGASPDTDAGKIGALYNAFMDEERIERLDLAPIAGDLAQIRDAKTKTDIAVLMGRSKNGFGGGLFNMTVNEDEKDPDHNALHTSQGGLGLPDRDYYLRDSFRDKKAKYRDYVARLLDMVGWADAQQRADDVVALETRIAEASWSRAESRDRDKTYNLLTPAELDALAPNFPWSVWLAAADVSETRSIIVRQRGAFPKLAKIFADALLETLQAWKAFHVVDQTAPFLSARFVTARFEFRGKELIGQPEERQRWRRATQLVGSSLGEAVGKEYVARYFPPDSKARMEEIIAELKRSLRHRIESLAWMTPETKARALEKLDLFGVKIGYPDKWRDYTALKIDPTDLIGNVRRATAFRWAYAVAKLDKPVDPDEWGVTPQTVNAYYSPTRNEIVFPAGILQPPFFDPNADMAINYGGIGGAIGHEMTHGFDDQGRKSDGHGVLANWWQPSDAVKFQAEAAKYGAQFDTYAVAPGVNVKGAQTMGENIADLGGILLALDAYRASLHGAPAPVVDGYTGDQRVFLGWAQVWRAKSRLDALKQQTTSDSHSPARFRVDGPLRNVDAWYDAFGVKPGDKLFLKPEDRVHIW